MSTALSRENTTNNNNNNTIINKNIDNNTNENRNNMNPTENNTEERLSLNMEFTDDELLYKPINGSSQTNDNSSLDSIDNISKMRYQSEKQTSIEKIVNDVLIPPLSESNGGDNNSGNDTANLHSVSPPLISDVDLSNISPLSSLQQHPQTNTINNHPYFSTLDNQQPKQGQQQSSSAVKTSQNNGKDQSLEKIKPINISNAPNKPRVHYSNTPNILSSEYANEYGQKSFHDSNNAVVKDDLYYLEYGNRNNNNNGSRQQRSSKYMTHSFNPNNLNLNLSSHRGHQSPHSHQLQSPHQLSGGGVAGHVVPSAHMHSHHHHGHHPHSSAVSSSASSTGHRSHHNTPNPHSSHSSAQQTPNTTQTSPLTPHSVRTAHTTIHSPHSVHSSHTPHTPHSMNHAFPRFTPYSTQTHPQSTTGGVGSTTSSQYSWQSSINKQKSPSSAADINNKQDADKDKDVSDENGVADNMNDNINVEERIAVKLVENNNKNRNRNGDNQLDPDDEKNIMDNQQQVLQQQLQQQKIQIPPQQQQQQIVLNNNGLSPYGGNNSLQRSKSKSGGSPTSTSSFINSAPRLNYEDEGLSAKDVEEVLSQLEIRPDTLRDSSTDFRPVFSCIRPIVCHKSNTPFYAQCSTAKLGYCTWCRQLRRGNQKQGSICLNCGERLTAKYHRWYPHLVRLEPLEKTRTKSMYIKYKPVFERFGITWHNEKQFDFVIDHYMLMKIYLSTENFNIDPLHLERTYMIGVFAGREFNTGALARKLLREGSKLAMFRADFPDYYDFLRDERAAVAEQMNLRFFQGIYKCYFHAHYTNIEGWYDPSVISRESIIETFKELCNTILAHTALAHINQNQQQKNGGNGGLNKNNLGGKSITITSSNGDNGRTSSGARKYTKKSNHHQQKRNNNNNMNNKRNNHNNRRQNNHHHNNNNNGNNNRMMMNQQQQMMQQQQQQNNRRNNNNVHNHHQNIITLTNPNGINGGAPMMNMIPNGINNNMAMMNGMNGINPNMFQPNPLGLTPNNMNGMGPMNPLQAMQLNGHSPMARNGVPPLNLVASNGQPPMNELQAQQQAAAQQQAQQQQQLQARMNQGGDKNNPALLAATQSMLASMPHPPSNLISNPLNQLSVTNMAAITPIAKVKTFQFNAPTQSTPQTMIRTNSHSQISPAYLPPLATTPRFTVPTPRGHAPSTQTYTAINLNNMNGMNAMHTASPIQLQPNGSNPPSVSMLAAASNSNNLQIPTSMLKNTSGSNSAHNSVSNSMVSNNDKNKSSKTPTNKKDNKNKNGDNKKLSPSNKNNKIITPRNKDLNKGSLNAGAAPFLLNTTGVISPPISPRNFNRNRFVAPPPPPQSFAFPPPPLPQTATNWLPVPPVLSATTPTNGSANQAMINGANQQMMNGFANQQMMNGQNQMNQMNMAQMNGINQQLNKDLINQQSGINVALVHQNRGSPLFTPTQSPQFRPFSH